MLQCLHIVRAHTHTVNRMGTLASGFSLFLVQPYRQFAHWYAHTRNRTAATEIIIKKITHHIEQCLLCVEFLLMLCAAHNCQEWTKKTANNEEQIDNRTVTIIQLNSILLPLLDIRHFKLWHLLFVVVVVVLVSVLYCYFGFYRCDHMQFL